MLDEKKKEVKQLELEKKRLHDLYRSYHRQTRALFESIEEDLREIQQQFNSCDPKPGIEELEAEITSTKQRIELVNPGNPRILEEYEKRARDIERLTERLAEFGTNLGDLESKIADIRQQWEPRLDQLIANISEAFAYNFEQIRCAGQVSVHKDEDDFAQWSVLVQVKFR
jgi:chromosome segregation ATPase